MLRETDTALREFNKYDIVLGNRDDAAASQIVSFSPPEITRRHLAAWSGIHADTVQVVRHEPFEYSFKGPYHLLIVSERAERYDGETSVEGLPKSAVRNFTRKLTFVPAGRQFNGWQKPRALARVTYFYIDPSAPLLDPDLGFAEVDFKPRIFFFDRDLWETAMKLRAQVESPTSGQRYYSEALSLVLLHELLRNNNGAAPPEPIVHGGLATWQQKRVAEYIEEHLADDISLAILASLAGLSPYHFSRAFRQSFAMPPHRFHINRRIERAKCMLANVSTSMTEIGLRLGFSESSAFTATFRKFTGRTPSDFRRSLQ
jgi:AraC family transcriptional regulator